MKNNKPAFPASLNSMRPILFLDFDDVICLNSPYGGYDVLMATTGNAEPDLWERIFDVRAKNTLLAIVDEFKPWVVLTTSWIRFMQEDDFVSLFNKTGLSAVSNLLHDEWCVTQPSGSTRNEAIESWLAEHHRGEPFVVLDDDLSGTGLEGSRISREGRLSLCEVGGGLSNSQISTIKRALHTKSS